MFEYYLSQWGITMSVTSHRGSEKQIDLTCVGILVLDLFGKAINAFPEKGTSVYFDTMETNPGGCAYNTGVDAARLGLNVAIQGRVGKDLFADTLLDALQKEGIQTDSIRRGEENTAFSFVMVPDDGDRRIYHTPGANNGFGPADLDLDAIRQSRVLHIAGASLMPALDGEPTFELLRFCREHGVVTCMDPVYREDIADLIVPALPLLDIFLPNREESVHITGLTEPEDQLKFYLDRGVGIAGIKMGADGLLISDGTECLRMGVYPKTVVDTCGAGDAFIAGFIYGHLQNWSLLKCARFASATAALGVQAMGATTGIPDAETVLQKMKKEKIDADHYRL